VPPGAYISSADAALVTEDTLAALRDTLFLTRWRMVKKLIRYDGPTNGTLRFTQAEENTRNFPTLQPRSQTRSGQGWR
jgi:hypothetical protein